MVSETKDCFLFVFRQKGRKQEANLPEIYYIKERYNRGGDGHFYVINVTVMASVPVVFIK